MTAQTSNSIRALAVITARGGSKGIPNKNITPVGGKPMIAWSIDAAKASRNIERIVVSTDSPEIRRIAEECGGPAPFLRPAELARDETPGVDPVIHAIQWLDEHEQYRPEWIVLLQPTSPLRT